MSAKKLNPRLWKSIKDKYLNEYDVKGQWNARKAQMAVKEYINRGGKFDESVPQEQTDLHKWSSQNWQYYKDTNLYLPEQVIKSTPDKDLQKQSNGKVIGQRKKYNKEILESMKKNNIY